MAPAIVALEVIATTEANPAPTAIVEGVAVAMELPRTETRCPSAVRMD